VQIFRDGFCRQSLYNTWGATGANDQCHYYAVLINLLQESDEAFPFTLNDILKAESGFVPKLSRTKRLNGRLHTGRNGITIERMVVLVDRADLAL
jgi:hypothetical protein